MIWILALLCLGLGGLIGFYQGPIRGAFSLIGLFLASVLAVPLAPLVKPLLPVLGVKNPIWLQVLPTVITLLAILILCAVAGAIIHRNIMVKFKYNEDDARFYRWERVQSRLGLCGGIIVGSVYFFLILIPIYIGGYFTVELASNDESPTSVKILNSVRNQMRETKLDHVVAAYDPTPAAIYKASDTIALIAQNRILESRLAHYPVFLSLAERKEFQDLATDVEFQNMFSARTPVGDFIKYPKIQAILNDTQLTQELITLIGSNLDDLNKYLVTGKSDKYDPEKILGCWSINTPETVSQARKKQTNLTILQVVKLKATLTPQVTGMTFTATTDNLAILKKENPANPFVPTVVVQGTWKKSGENYVVNLPGSTPENSEVAMQSEAKLSFGKDGVTLVFERE